MIQPINNKNSASPDLPENKSKKAPAVLAPVLGKFSGLPQGILGEYNTRRNKNASILISKVYIISRAVSPVHEAAAVQHEQLN